MKAITGFFMAWGNFSIIPCPVKKWDEGARNYMVAALPVIGLILGAVWYGLFALLTLLHVEIALKAALMTACPFVSSGCIHLDGFMDCNDAILSRKPMEEKQKILKDAHVGAFGVASAILLFLLFFGAMWAFLEKAEGYRYWLIIAIPALTRAVAAGDVLECKPLAGSQYHASFNPTGGLVWAVRVIWLAIAVVTAWASTYFGICCVWNATDVLFRIVVLILFAGLVTVLSGYYARKQLGGMSGDIAGYSVVWGELAAVVALAVI